MRVIATQHCTIKEVGGLYSIETDHALIHRIQQLEDDRDNNQWQRRQDALAAFLRGEG